MASNAFERSIERAAYPETVSPITETAVMKEIVPPIFCSPFSK